MGTRLYPMTKDPMVLEMLADVPRGTHAVLQRIQNVPDVQWLQPANIKRLENAIKEDSQYGYDETGDNWSPERAVKDESTFCGQPYDPDMLRSLWLRFVARPEVRKLESFLSEGWGRIMADDDFLVRITRNEHGGSVGCTKLFGQMVHILKAQADGGRLILNTDDWTVQAKSWTGEPVFTCDPDWHNNADQSKFCIGPKVKIAKLEGLSWS